MNLLQNQIQCIECKSKKLIKDYVRQEVYCSRCGLVLVNNEIPTIKQRKIKEHITLKMKYRIMLKLKVLNTMFINPVIKGDYY